jgi:hypothetical protein
VQKTSKVDRMSEKQMKRYLSAYDLASTHGDLYPCEYGHYDCAIVPRGACSNEAQERADAEQGKST